VTANPAEATKYQLSVDTGGTFTDGFVTGPNGAAQVKVDTTPADPTEGFAAVLQPRQTQWKRTCVRSSQKRA